MFSSAAPDGEDTGLFYIEDAVLVADSDVYWESAPEFEAIAEEYLDSGVDKVVLDLSRASFIASNFVGSLSSFIIKAGHRGCTVRILGTTDISWLFEIMGGQNLFEFEVV